jgi:acyl-coenzyme A thioesterase PaaI-like protein
MRDTRAGDSTRPNPRPRVGPTTAGSSRQCARCRITPGRSTREAADLIEKVSDLLGPFDADEWATPSGRRIDLPNRGNILPVPMKVRRTDDGRIEGWARFRRFHLGRNGAVHGGALALLFDSVLGMTSGVITGGPRQRTAYLHINYRQIVPIDKELQVDARLDRVEGRKIFVSGRLSDGDTVLTDSEALFVLLKPGQP